MKSKYICIRDYTTYDVICGVFKTLYANSYYFIELVNLSNNLYWYVELIGESKSSMLIPNHSITISDIFIDKYEYRELKINSIIK